MEKYNIEPETFYRPSEIVEKGWILNSRGERNQASYNYVLKMLKHGRLVGVDYSKPGSHTPYWKVQGSEILRYLREVEKQNV